MLLLPATPEVIAAFVAEAESAPEELSTIVNVMPAPPMPFVPEEHHGRLVVMATLAYAGPVDAGESAIAPFRALAEPLADLVRPMPYPELYPPEDPDFHPIASIRTMFLDGVDLRAAETIVEHLRTATSPMAATQLRVLGGAVARVPADATAFAHRERRIIANVAAMYGRPEEASTYMPWVDGLAASARPGRRGRLRRLPGRRGRGARPRRLPGTDLGPTGGDQGAVRPDQPVPAQSERAAGELISAQPARRRPGRARRAVHERGPEIRSRMRRTASRSWPAGSSSSQSS